MQLVSTARGATMDVVAKLRTLVRKGWRSTAANSYSLYERKRERERKEAKRRDAGVERSAESNRREAERERVYEERYDAERAAKESRAEPPPADTSK
jgi:hypothetical protein